eukprot:INCI17280.1.p2 GENE.INCI17280.1~~INCI17280.1.p2  ORF type:complete len:120 (+),score=17.81 INCI17280.1:173-532(+)
MSATTTGSPHAQTNVLSLVLVHGTQNPPQSNGERKTKTVFCFHVRQHSTDNDIPTDAAAVNPFAHLLQLNILPWIKAMPPHLSRIQLLLTHSKASVASVPAASFNELILLAALSPQREM